MPSNSNQSLHGIEAKAGDLAIAIATANTITNDFKGVALSNIAAEQANTGLVAGAQTTANSIASAPYKAKAFCAIGAAQVKTGDLAGALHSCELARVANDAVSFKLFKMKAVCAIAIVQAKSGDLHSARQYIDQAATSLDAFHDTMDAAYLGDIAVARARMEDFPAAERWIATVADPFSRVRCFTRLAEARLNVNNPKAADDENGY